MSSQQVRSNDATASASVASVDMKLEVSSSPFRMSIAQRSSIQGSGGASTPTAPQVTTLEFTPPGSGSSVQFRRDPHVGRARFGSGPASGRLRHRGCARGTRRARRRRERRVNCATGTACRFPGTGERISGPHPERLSYGWLVSFSGPYRLARLQPLPWRQVAAHLMAPDAVFANHRGQKRRTYAVVANREVSWEVEI
jgi:hypothetical protein